MELKSILEALLFSSRKPLTVDELKEVLTTVAGQEGEEVGREHRRIKTDRIHEEIVALAREIEAAGRSYTLVEIAGAWQFVTRPDYAPWLRTLLGIRSRPPKLSQPALETLAIVAYRQPITRAEIEQIRGVSVDGVIQTLTDRGLIEVTGRAEVVGRPSTYGTTAQFLEYFGLGNLDDLPASEELRRLPIEKPESLLTVDPGLATAPPEELAGGPNAQTTLALDAPPPAGGEHQP